MGEERTEVVMGISLTSSPRRGEDRLEIGGELEAKDDNDAIEDDDPVLINGLAVESLPLVDVYRPVSPFCAFRICDG